MMFVSGHPTDTQITTDSFQRRSGFQALTSLGVDAPELYRAISDKAMQCLQAMSVRLLPVDMTI